MSREHLYKAKRLDNGEWVEGFYVGDVGDGCHEICDINDSLGHRVEIDPETVCEYTGLMGAEKEKLFEGDLAFDEYDEENGEIVFVEGCYYFETSGHITGLNEVNNYLCIIGNVHNESEEIPND